MNPGYIIFNDQEKVLIAESESKKKVYGKLEKVSKISNIEIEDHTED